MTHPRFPAMSTRTRRSALAATAALAVVSAGTLAVATQAHAVSGCQVNYNVTSQWAGGFGATIDIKNLGDPLSNWTLKFAFPSGQTITQLWNGNVSQSGANVTVTNLSYNGSLGTNATVSPGFNGTWTTSNPAPTNFSLNGITCNGTTPPTTTPPTTTPPTTTPPTTPPPPAGGKPHIILSTDMPPVNGIPGGEAGPASQKSDLDDVQTLVRFLSYADDFNVDGLIASSGTFANYANKQNILDVINGYAQVYPSLKANDPDYPTPDSLRAVTKQGRDGTWGQSATDILGTGKDSEASDHIISVVDKATTPVWFVSGGGPRELGQALWKVQNTRSAADLATFVSKVRAYFIDDQDGSAAWMRNTFPGLFVISNKCYWGMANTGPFNGTWLKANVTTGHGALGADYPLSHWTYNDQGVYEGDTPDFLYLLNGTQGLGDPANPALGGWGGRFQGSGNRWTCASEGTSSISRWESARNWDFAGRMNWAVKPYNQANHNPVVQLNGDTTRNVLTVNAAAGSTFNLSATGTTDPDGNSLSYKWYQYPTTAGLSLTNSTSPNASFTVPGSHGTQVDIVLEVTDNGSPNLTSYRRIIINVQ